MTARYLALVLIFATPIGTGSHSRFKRSVNVDPAAKQGYVVPDEALWRNARSDLGDLRLRSKDNEVPYILTVQTGQSHLGATPVRLFNKGAVGPKTQFLLDVDVPEYDEIGFNITKKDFVSRASIEAADSLSADHWVKLGTFTIFDFSKEELGANTRVRLRTPARYRFLRVVIESGIAPDDVRDASVANLQVDKARYRDAAVRTEEQQRDKHTIFKWSLDKKVPLDRVAVEVEAHQVNFSRPAALFCDDRRQIPQDISRVHLMRFGRMADSETLAIETNGMHCSQYRLEIDDQDNPPLRIKSVKAQTMERRIYFNAADSEVTLLYGDEKLSPPVYDFAKFFTASQNATEARLGPEEKNPDYQPRPDDRPWMERHPTMLWIVLLTVIIALGAVAFKSLKK